MTRRSGAVTLSELVLVFWMFLLVLAALAEFVSGQGRLARQQGSLVRLQEARRTTEMILGREVRALTWADIRPAAGRDLGIRAARGSGPVCSATGDRLALRYAGPRRPEPEKDSVLVVGVAGDEVRGLVAVSGSGCDGDGMTLTLDRAPVVRPGFAFVFEPGSYHAVDRAVRYRLGAAGRQPLTEALFAGTELHALPGSAGLLIRLRPHPDSVARGTARAMSLRLPSLNRANP